MERMNVKEIRVDSNDVWYPHSQIMTPKADLFHKKQSNFKY